MPRDWYFDSTTFLPTRSSYSEVTGRTPSRLAEPEAVSLQSPSHPHPSSTFFTEAFNTRLLMLPLPCGHLWRVAVCFPNVTGNVTTCVARKFT